MTEITTMKTRSSRMDRHRGGKLLLVFGHQHFVDQVTHHQRG